MNRIIYSFVVVINLAFLVGCGKKDSVFGWSSTNKCQIEKIVHTPCCGLSEAMMFAYNKMGDPVSITQLPTTNTGTPNYLFKYDKKNRLTELYGLYEGGNSGLFYHKYFYANPGNSKIVLDSVYFFPVLKNNVMVSYYSAVASHLFYDKWDRIVKDSTVSSSTFVVNNFVYDIDGNLAGRTYDNKLNPHQTNKIWMFLDRDYSANNPFTADSYNKEGLPTSINFSNESGNYLKLIGLMHKATISYDCK